MARKMLVADLLCGAGGSSTGAKRALDVAWAAGVIEGEGCVYAQVRTTKYGTNAASYVRVVMSDADIVERLRTIFGGKFLPYKPTNGLGSKPLFRWEVSTRNEFLAVCEAIYPWMGERRRAQIDKARAALVAHPLISASERVRRTWLARRTNQASKASA